uniref:Putative secreted protein n=1 Tax=Panstrongylus lignarius TaxID=156445 RepID=A0A224Y3B8_9HEMI
MLSHRYVFLILHLFLISIYFEYLHSLSIQRGNMIVQRMMFQNQPQRRQSIERSLDLSPFLNHSPKVLMLHSLFYFYVHLNCPYFLNQSVNPRNHF